MLTKVVAAVYSVLFMLNSLDIFHSTLPLEAVHVDVLFLMKGGLRQTLLKFFSSLWDTSPGLLEIRTSMVVPETDFNGVLE